MTRCENCAAAAGCPSAFTRWAQQCEAFAGPTVQPAITSLDAAFWAMVAEDDAAMADYLDERDMAMAASRGIL